VRSWRSRVCREFFGALPSGEIALEKVMSDEQVPTGELVLSSGGDRIFPKGLAIGRVSKVSQGSDNFLNIQVKPMANLSKLEEVLIVTKIDERQATPEQAGPMRAADVLAERLPTVPPKPADATGTTTTGVAPKPGAVVDGKPAQPKLAPPKPKEPGLQEMRSAATPAIRKTGHAAAFHQHGCNRWILEAAQQRLLRKRRNPRSSLSLSLQLRNLPNNVALTYTSGEQVEVYRSAFPRLS